jgi:hypothetical protein
MRLKTNCFLTLALTFLLIASGSLRGQGEKADSVEAGRQKFEEMLRWKRSSGDPSENTNVEVSGNQIRITLTGGKSWNEATARFDAKYFGLLCLLWEIFAEKHAGHSNCRQAFQHYDVITGDGSRYFD